ncbi:MAG: Rpn family recombination-promoting nuclease/putative transposase [Chitinophagia bacterium]|nr:Rpn family recombination-promoting nuclease/putative transposase [Chitinophagia bacterium]
MRNTIRFDWAIKRLLRNKANFGILEGFLSELLGEDIVIESILESESNREDSSNKGNRVDMLVQNSKGELIIIEVQSDYMRDYLLRMLFGTAKLIVDNMDVGMLYGRIKKVISVNIVYFDLGRGEDYVYRGGTVFTGLNRHDTLHLSEQEQGLYHTRLIDKILPEYYIIKVNQFDGVAKNTLDEWIDFLKNETVREGTAAKGLKEAREKLDVLQLSREERRDYERYIDSWRDNESALISNFEAGELKGREEGAAEAVRAIALNCLKAGMSVIDIAQLTGLTEEYITTLAH